MSSNPYQSQLDQLEIAIAETKKMLADPDMAELAQEEIARLEAEQKMLEDAADQMNSDPTTILDENTGRKGNCTMEIRSGAGGDEAKIWANELKRMYERFAETTDLTIQVIDELVIKFTGSAQLGGTRLTAFELLCYESGVHRVQRVPETESQGRIHTSTASVAVLPEVPINAVEIRDEDLEWQFMRSSGAGGQSVNKTSSAVRLTHAPSGISVSARQEKKQEQNRKIALELLRSQLWEIEDEKRQKEIGTARSVIGRAQRAEKIRTYNFPQSRITDHRSKQSWFNLYDILGGNLEKMLLDLRTFFLENQSTPTEDVSADN
ncbi:MAG: PCRF domain-containing protein [Patescibacteria group bacterium]